MSARGAALLVAVVCALAVSACGSDGAAGSPQDQASGAGSGGQQGQADLSNMPGGGDAGMLVFGGQEIPITSATCVLDMPEPSTFDIATTSDEGFRVLLLRDHPQGDISAAILDPDVVQWFPRGISGDEAQLEGETFTSGPTLYVNNQDDRTVEVSFTIECSP